MKKASLNEVGSPLVLTVGKFIVEKYKKYKYLKWAKKHYKKGFKKLLVAPHKYTDYQQIKKDQEKIHLFMRKDYFTK